jgi:hypothetical protein
LSQEVKGVRSASPERRAAAFERKPTDLALRRLGDHHVAALDRPLEDRPRMPCAVTALPVGPDGPRSICLVSARVDADERAAELVADQMPFLSTANRRRGHSGQRRQQDRPTAKRARFSDLLSPKRREICPEPGDVELKTGAQADRCPLAGRSRAREQTPPFHFVLDQFTGRTREQHLAAVGNSPDASSPVHPKTDVPLLADSGSAVCSPMRTHTSAPSGNSWVASSR